MHLAISVNLASILGDAAKRGGADPKGLVGSELGGMRGGK